MCGRFALAYKDTVEVTDHFDLINPSLPLPCFNITPSMTTPIIRSFPDAARRMNIARWGLIPSWAKEENIGFKMINARAETISKKPAFKNLFQKSRCLIPATGFYEWGKMPTNKSKQPYYFKDKQSTIFAFAGLYDLWKAQNGQTIESFTIITTSANPLVKKIHHRMPVILSPNKYQTWLDSKSTGSMLTKLLTPYPADQMTAYPVDPAVNNVKVDESICIKPLEQITYIS